MKRAALLIAETIVICAVHLVNALSYILPARVLVAVFTGAGYAVYYCVPPVRRNYTRSISEAMPEITDEKRINYIARTSLIGALLANLDVFLFLRHGDKIINRLEITGMENADLADSEGKGVIFLSAHIGSYPLTVPVGARVGKQWTPIVANPDSTPVPRLVRTLFKFGSKLDCDPDAPFFMTGRNTIERAREHLEKGKRLGITVDITGKGIGEFFGRPAALADGIAHFAYDTGAVILPACVLRGEGVFDRRLVGYEPVRYELSGDRTADVKTIMQAVLSALETEIRAVPEQWTSWHAIRRWWRRAEKLSEDKEIDTALARGNG